MKITIDEAAKILGVKSARASKRLRALGYDTKCRRCVKGYVANGFGGCVCWTCGGTGRVIEITEAQAHEAAARIAAGDLSGYFAQNEAKHSGETELDAGEVGRIIVDIFTSLRDVVGRSSTAVRHRAKISAIREWNDTPRHQRGGVIQNDDGTWSVTRIV